MKTLSEVLALSVDYLKQRSIERPRFLSETLLMHILRCPRVDLYMQWDFPLTEDQLQRYRPLLSRVGKGEPVEYVTGEVCFWNLMFSVDRRVLIPRQESEILVEKVCLVLKEKSLQSKILWDVCCGSGCLGISIKKKFPEIEVCLSDLSLDALALAQDNAKSSNVEVNFFHGDLLAPFEGKRADFFVCNPPYLSEEEYRQTDASVRNFEPRCALVSGNTGLEMYEKLACCLPHYLNKGAFVFFEIGSGQAECMFKIFSDSCWSSKKVEKDWAGHDRFFFLEFQSFFAVP